MSASNNKLRVFTPREKKFLIHITHIKYNINAETIKKAYIYEWFYGINKNSKTIIQQHFKKIQKMYNAIEMCYSYVIHPRNFIQGMKTIEIQKNINPYPQIIMLLGRGYKVYVKICNNQQLNTNLENLENSKKEILKLTILTTKAIIYNYVKIPEKYPKILLKY